MADKRLVLQDLGRKPKNEELDELKFWPNKRQKANLDKRQESKSDLNIHPVVVQFVVLFHSTPQNCRMWPCEVQHRAEALWRFGHFLLDDNVDNISPSIEHWWFFFCQLCQTQFKNHSVSGCTIVLTFAIPTQLIFNLKKESPCCPGRISGDEIKSISLTSQSEHQCRFSSCQLKSLTDPLGPPLTPHLAKMWDTRGTHCAINYIIKVLVKVKLYNSLWTEAPVCLWIVNQQPRGT